MIFQPSPVILVVANSIEITILPLAQIFSSSTVTTEDFEEQDSSKGEGSNEGEEDFGECPAPFGHEE